ncbi:MAG: hypothetical protein OET90_03405 [Desulfuromonadales bacterium]|nr:hypothetical protein [Desulfuromonadales bacterium]
MVGREKITELLRQMEKELKELEIAYEQYFMGIEKRSPETQRQRFTLRIRKAVTLYIPQTDLRFKLQGLSSRYNSFCGNWDRILRLIDEGRYERHTARIQRRGAAQTAAKQQAAAKAETNGSEASSADSLYDDLVNAHQSCNLRAPKREQVTSFLNKQKEAIEKRFGDQPVDFFVVTEAGKPKVKVRLKK